ncbi:MULTISPECIES: CDP-diacylglycerol--glycerol-3-phosphate 3-phosphatidyltransferase [Actinopolyspora]|uniref:CDP-diacylglycerol--glycerol-3-phosphate 3-phosphatidyltransferase n=1 Tax=Actinopolyspora saharensis TaxID=995062 RepID=A0A1H1AU49_9ACTN|nr:MULTISPECIES: CDP-diacylglycerol--glycerol-3-phosphate 3-phosphatidyltransferase [Actinopolyspora]NHD17145.1 CDP-diacylglycerol--glycerol-3-phosphate 3-phosphatidyltransferase [Actinopolyspora sp. BKK2]NHE76297.1 CDP-diacylglycerol--glycerol-3-phosphate 3-phosphatidyltransferase [Actinopolyspora sp. BKK1]SDQ43268.1 CDP-diacylglycerol--glycerol-3-phosphate 3-phosphatidyltransferase [Actinopolyspora saharensis]
MTADSAASNRAASGSGGADGDERGTPLVNIANALTTSRLILVPVFLVVLFWAGGHEPFWRWIATAVFVLASVTDRIDGELARRRGLITDFGKIADPLADKALTGAALLGLSALGELPWWVSALIIFREMFVTVLRFWVIRHGVIPASPGGKLKTLLQAVAIGLYLLPLGDSADPLKWVVMGAAVAATVGTGADYVVRAVRLRALSRRARKGRG